MVADFFEAVKSKINNSEINRTCQKVNVILYNILRGVSDHADKRRTARLPCGNNGAAYQEQMEIVNNAQSSCLPLEI